MPNTPNGWRQIAERFERETHFHHCIGAIDGRHMFIQNPCHAGSFYYNYKGQFSIVLMALCDSNYCFTYAYVGAQGRISDGGVFNSCSLALKIDRGILNLPPPEPLTINREKFVPYVIVADNAFALKQNIMVPHAQRSSHEYGSPNRIFNYRLSAARSRIENTFGIFTAVFRAFRKPISLEPKKARIIVESGIVLHNFFRRNRTSTGTYTPPNMMDRYTVVDGRQLFQRGSWRSDAGDMTSCIALPPVARRAKKEAESIRDEFGKFYSSESGRVSWQVYLQ